MALFENMKAETVRDLNLRDPVVVRGDQKLRDVVQEMKRQELGCAIVVDDTNTPLGMFTESMLTQLVVANPSALDEPVSQHASQHWPQVQLKDQVATVLEALDVKNVRFLSVVDDAGKLVGLAGQKGLMEYVADHFPRQVMVQRVGQAPYLHTREGA